MSDLQASNPQSKDRAANWGFAAFVLVITAIAVTLPLTQIYLQNPR